MSHNPTTHGSGPLFFTYNLCERGARLGVPASNVQGSKSTRRARKSFKLNTFTRVLQSSAADTDWPFLHAGSSKYSLFAGKMCISWKPEFPQAAPSQNTIFRKCYFPYGKHTFPLRQRNGSSSVLAIEQASKQALVTEVSPASWEPHGRVCWVPPGCHLGGQNV